MYSVNGFQTFRSRNTIHQHNLSLRELSHYFTKRIPFIIYTSTSLQAYTQCTTLYLTDGVVCMSTGVLRDTSQLTDRLCCDYTPTIIFSAARGSYSTTFMVSDLACVIDCLATAGFKYRTPFHIISDVVSNDLTRPFLNCQ